LAEKEALDNAGLLESDLDDSELDDEDRAYKIAAREDEKKEAGIEALAGKDNESSGESESEDGE